MPTRGLRFKTYELLKDGNNSKAGVICDWIIIFFIVLSILQMAINTFPVNENWGSISNIIEYITIAIFTIEYILRLWTAPQIYPHLSPIKSRLKYLITPMALIDLLAILPFYLPFIISLDLRALRAIRLLRLLRLFKLVRYTDAVVILGKVIRNKFNQLLSAFFVVVLLLIIASLLMFNIENQAQPEKFANIFDAIWWSVATLTTVGYGDIYPVTTAGKILSGMIAILGIGMVAIPTGIISSGFVGELAGDNYVRKEEKGYIYCPYCGRELENDRNHLTE